MPKIGTDVNYQSWRDGFTAFLLAVRLGYDDCAEELIKAEADTKVCNIALSNARHVCCAGYVHTIVRNTRLQSLRNSISKKVRRDAFAKQPSIGAAVGSYDRYIRFYQLL